MKEFFTKSKKVNTALFFFGLLLLMMEISKQLYLYFVYFDRHYDVWYVPFQLCSIPMYLCIIRYALSKFYETALAHKTHMTPKATSRSRSISTWMLIIDTFLMDYAMLGGVAALLVPDGFTYPGHVLLTCHGYLWHIFLLLISLIIWKNHLADVSLRGFLRTLFIFLPLTVCAEILNVMLHPFGDCDMFYISPYHPSSQPIFHNIDLYLGRSVGIVIYIMAMILGAFLIHMIYAGYLYIANSCMHK